ncbi:MAG: hypothetical protein KBA38_06785 [Negativicutes bacterium]|nr:hypothetical protein [Negativicutes bacterium]
MIFWMNILGALGFVTFLLGIIISSFSYDFLWGIILIPVVIFGGIKWIGSSYYDLDLNYKKFVSGRKLKTNENAYIIYSRFSILFGQNHNLPILGIEFEEKEWVLARVLISHEKKQFPGRLMSLQDGMGELLFRYSQIEIENNTKIKRYSPEITRDESIALAQLKAIIRN